MLHVCNTKMEGKKMQKIPSLMFLTAKGRLQIYRNKGAMIDEASKFDMSLPMSIKQEKNMFVWLVSDVSAKYDQNDPNVGSN